MKEPYSIWECLECGEVEHLTFEDMADDGIPICQNEICGNLNNEMELIGINNGRNLFPIIFLLCIIVILLGYICLR